MVGTTTGLLSGNKFWNRLYRIKLQICTCQMYRVEINFKCSPPFSQRSQAWIQMMMPQPSMAGSLREHNWLSGWEGWHSVSPLSITATLVNHGHPWGHACSSGCIVFSAEWVTLPCVWKDKVGWFHMSQRKHVEVAVIWYERSNWCVLWRGGILLIL